MTIIFLTLEGVTNKENKIHEKTQAFKLIYSLYNLKSFINVYKYVTKYKIKIFHSINIEKSSVQIYHFVHCFLIFNQLLIYYNNSLKYVFGLFL